MEVRASEQKWHASKGDAELVWAQLQREASELGVPNLYQHLYDSCNGYIGDPIRAILEAAVKVGVARRPLEPEEVGIIYNPAASSESTTHPSL